METWTPVYPTIYLSGEDKGNVVMAIHEMKQSGSYKLL